VVGITCCFVGPVEDGERLLRPLRRFGAPVLDACVPKPFLEHQSMFDPSFRPGWWYYFRACDPLPHLAAGRPDGPRVTVTP
jgi:hypothetical protein